MNGSIAPPVRLVRLSHKVAIAALLTLNIIASNIISSPALSQEVETSPAATQAEMAEMAARGKTLAAQKCASCHAIGNKDDSLNKDAPPFRLFDSQWRLEDLEESLAEGIVTGHEEMPEFVFTPIQITDFLEFLRTLRK